MNAMTVAGAAAQTLPLVAGIAPRARSTPGRRWMIAWGAYSTIGMAAELLTLQRGASTLWMYQWMPPIDGTLALLALACWQQRPALRRAFRWVAAVAILLHVAAITLWQHPRGVLLEGAPAYGILCAAAALFTFVSRSLRASEPLHRQAWFWISGGLTLYNAAWAMVLPLTAWGLENDRFIYLRANELFFAINIMAYGVVAAGLLRPAPMQRAAVFER